MSKSKHTPGPWKDDGWDGHGGICIWDKLNNHIATADAIHPMEPGSQIHHANARLIAAAPALLEACKTMVNQFISYTPQLNNDKCWEIIQARAALELAEKEG